MEAAFFSSTEYLTQLGYHISYTLESTRPGDGPHIDYDVEIVARSLRRNLVYLYTSRRKNIILPVTEQKGYNIDMEIADFIAYSVRRYISNFMIHRHTEFPLENLGPVNWSVFTYKHIIVENNTGFPWLRFNEYIERETMTH